MLQVYDRLLKHHSVSSAVVLVLGAVIAITTESFLRYGRTYLLSVYSMPFDAEMPPNTMRKIVNASLETIRDIEPAGIQQAQNDLGILKGHYSGQSIIALFDLPFTLLYLIVVWYIGGGVVFVPIIVIAIAVIAAFGFKRIAASAVQERDNDKKMVQGALLKVFCFLLQVKILGIEEDKKEMIAAASEKYSKSRKRSEVLNLLANDSVAVLSQISTVGIVIVGAIYVMNGSLTTGGLAACTILGGRCIGPVSRLFAYWIRLETMIGAKNRINEIEALGANPIFSNDSNTLTSLDDGSVLFDDVQFTADQGEYSLSLEVQSGGKYSLNATDGDIVRSRIILSLIGGYIAPKSGTVLVAGKPLNHYGRDRYCRDVPFVTHNAVLLRGSLISNLTYFQPELEEEALRLCEVLGVKSLISKLPYGFKTKVTNVDAPPVDQGVVQIIAIIRALVRKPKILLLDRAEAGLDIGQQKSFVELLNSCEDLTVIAQPATRLLKEALSDDMQLKMSISEEVYNG
jgi:ATP-binding cassette subfamily C protein LapB